MNITTQDFNNPPDITVNSHINDGNATFSITGTALVGNTLSISTDISDPDGTGTLVTAGNHLLTTAPGQKLLQHLPTYSHLQKEVNI